MVLHSKLIPSHWVIKPLGITDYYSPSLIMTLDTTSLCLLYFLVGKHQINKTTSIDEQNRRAIIYEVELSGLLAYTLVDRAHGKFALSKKNFQKLTLILHTIKLINKTDGLSFLFLKN